MRALGRWLLRSFIYSSILIGGVVAFLYFLPDVWTPPVKNWLEKKIAEGVQGQARIYQIRMSKLVPLTISFQRIVIKSSNLGMDLSLERFDLGMGMTLAGMPLLVVDLEKPLFKWQLPPFFLAALKAVRATPDAAPPAPAWAQFASGIPTEVRFAIHGGGLDITGVDVPIPVRVSDLDLRVRAPGLDPWQVKLSGVADLAWGDLSLPLPLRLETQQLKISKERVEVPAGQLEVAGLKLSLSGLQDFGDGLSQWQAELAETPIEKLPALPKFLPRGQWSGAIRAGMHWESKPGRTPLFRGLMNLRGAKGELRLSDVNYDFQGPLAMTADVKVRHQDGWFLDGINVSANADDLAMKWGLVFSKPANMPLRLDLKVTGQEDQITVDPSRIQLGPLTAELRGLWSLRQPGSGLQLRLFPSRLEGLESAVEALKGQVLKGTAAGNLIIGGDWRAAEKIQIQVRDLDLRDAEIGVNWRDDSAGVEFKGPVQTRLRLAGKFLNGQIKEGSASGDLNLAQTEIISARAVKPPGQPLRLAGALNWDGRSVRSPGLEIQIFGGRAFTQGRVELTSALGLDLQARAEKFDLAQVARFLKLPRQLQIAGRGGFNSLIKGELSPLGVLQSTIVSRGSLRMELDYLRWLTPVQPGDSGSAVAARDSGVPAGWLPDVPLLREANWEMRILADEISAAGMKAEQVRLEGELRRGYWRGKLAGMRTMGGRVQIDPLSLQLLHPEARGKGVIKLSGVNTDLVLSRLMPELRQYGSGRLLGQVEVELPTKGPEATLSGVQAELKLNLINGMMNTQAFVEATRKALAQKGIPVAAAKKLGPVGFEAQLAGRFANSKLQMREFILETKTRDQLAAQGSVGLDLDVDLTGTLYLSQSPVSGSVLAANSDGRGRLVLPLAIKGQLRDLEFAFAESTLEAVAKRTLVHEAEKLKSSAKQGLKKSLDKILGR